MTATLHFLGWERPALESGAEWLLNKYRRGERDGGMFDLRGVIVALPGGRAARRLLEILTQRADDAKLPLLPPRIMTVGPLMEELYQPELPPAGIVARALAWAEALESIPRERLRSVFAELPAVDDLPGRLHLAEMLDGLHAELAGDGLAFADVAERGLALEGFPDAERWRILGEIQAAYRRQLESAGLSDAQFNRRDALDRGRCRADGDIILLGVSDLNRIQCRMLEQVADRVTALIHAPASLKDRFNGFGRVISDIWSKLPVEIADDRIAIADGPEDQAAVVVGALARLGGRYTAEEITVGVPDDEVTPCLIRQLSQRHLPSRSATGRLVSSTSPAMLLRAVADYIDGRRIADLAALLRHPDLEAWLRERLPELDGRWINELDKYRGWHLPFAFVSRWLDGPIPTAALRTAHAEIEDLLKPLTAAPRSPQAWAAPITQLLLAVYHRPLDRNRPDERITLAACEAIHAALQELVRVPAALAPTLTAGEMSRLLLHSIAEQPIPPQADTNAIELVGWLELPLDDAPVAIVTGFNEGRVPQTVNGHAFLPNRLRMHLGLLDNDRRLARDCYALQAILHSRPEVRIIAGRRTGENDPLTPSRLLFACDAETTARRISAFLKPAAAVPRPAKTKPERVSRFFVPAPSGPYPPIESMQVTQFRNYLACKYRYYLRHVRRLAAVSDRGEELDAPGFGSLLHETLEAFGRSPAKHESEAEHIRDWLSNRLSDLARDRFGTSRLPAIQVQLEQARLRLSDFADWQSRHARDGWRFADIDLSFQGTDVRFGVEPFQVYLNGRIDRIDRHQETGQFAIVDYKTAESELDPNRTHRDGDDWIDLQLPLYRHLAATRGVAGDVRLGYIVLPKQRDAVRLVAAEWTADDLRSADELACTIIQEILNGAFWPRNEDPPAFGEDFAWICQDGQYADTATAVGEDAA